MDLILSTKDLCYQVDHQELLNNISLEIPRGSFVGLIGPNGCGKSTLLKTIYRVNKASSGAVYINGKEIATMSNREVARRMAVVTQESDINFDFSVMEMMMIGRYAHRSLFSKRNYSDEKICRDALAMVGMESFENRSFISLSGGEKQRVLIASAFSRETELIVLDEPTNHLDLGYQFLIMDLLKEKERITVFTAVHDMNMAMQYCDYVIVLDKGTVVSNGKPEEVLTEELLEKIFRVKSKIIHNSNGKSYIMYMGSKFSMED